MTKGFGKVNLSNTSGTKYLKELRPKEGETIAFRLIPPVKSGVESGKYAEWIALHRGFQGVNKTNPDKPANRSFVCIQDRDFRTKEIRVRCPMCDLIAQRQADLDELETQLKARGVKEKSDEWNERRKPLTQWLKDYYIDRKFYLNAMEKDSRELVLVALTGTTLKKLREEVLKPLSDSGIDPFDPDGGVWLKISRTGKFKDVVDRIEVIKERAQLPDGRIAELNIPAPMTQEEQAKALEECVDLPTHGFRISAEQITKLTTCSGDPEEVDRILGIIREGSPAPVATTKWTPPTTLPQAQAPAVAAPAPVQQAPVQAPPPQVAPPAPQAAPVDSPEVAALKAQIAALQAAQTQQVAPPAVTTTVTEPQTAAAPVPATPSNPENVQNEISKFMAAFDK